MERSIGRETMENDYRVNIVSLEIDRDAEASAESQNESTQSSSRADTDSNLDECGGWTNEKHNSYLDYLESSFVKQLYSLLGETQTLSRTRLLPSDQFMVLQNGCWPKVNFEKKRDRIQENSLGHEDSAQSTAEASGQNFREQEEEEKKGCNSEVSRKRKRAAKYDDSSLNDQVVP